jgi:hypothetical protein
MMGAERGSGGEDRGVELVQTGPPGSEAGGRSTDESVHRRLFSRGHPGPRLPTVPASADGW